MPLCLPLPVKFSARLSFQRICPYHKASLSPLCALIICLSPHNELLRKDISGLEKWVNLFWPDVSLRTPPSHKAMEGKTVVNLFVSQSFGLRLPLDITIHGANRFQKIVSQLTLSSFLAYRPRCHPIHILIYHFMNGSEVGINLLLSPLKNLSQLFWV